MKRTLYLNRSLFIDLPMDTQIVDATPCLGMEGEPDLVMENLSVPDLLRLLDDCPGGDLACLLHENGDIDVRVPSDGDFADTVFHVRPPDGWLVRGDYCEGSLSH